MNLLFESKRIIVNPIFNILTLVLNCFIKRNDNVLLFGGRFGTRFSGNSRFLFQYCVKEKEKYGFERVIWITRSSKVFQEMQSMGYEVYMAVSLKGIYWHLKAGKHIISGAQTPEKNGNVIHHPDILTCFSLGAKCYQLFHCAEFTKGNPRDGGTNSLSTIETFLIQAYNSLYNIGFIRHFILYPGGWGDATWLASTPSDDSEPYRVVVTGMPEMCGCVEYTPSEKALIASIKGENKKIIMFVPTWRRKDSQYSSPLNDVTFCKYLKERNCLWIEKLHPSALDDMRADYYDPECSMLINAGYDINVLIPICDLLVTDYSSAYQKAIWYNKPFCFFAADLDDYTENEMGLADSFVEFAKPMFDYDTNDLITDLEQKLKGNYYKSYKDEYDIWKHKYFSVDETNYETICKKLFEQD